ncbi:TIGR02186 family protein [Pelagibacterium halotolerans]|uniref:TIGR02186 family protein n=1 Tax=Pelagibacterium halotolerans TaxID=531813 RepID=UPI00384CBEBE
MVDSDVVSSSSSSFFVRTQGLFERAISRPAFVRSLYGVAAVLIAAGTGWLGGVLFRR